MLSGARRRLIVLWTGDRAKPAHVALITAAVDIVRPCGCPLRYLGSAGEGEISVAGALDVYGAGRSDLVAALALAVGCHIRGGR